MLDYTFIVYMFTAAGVEHIAFLRLCYEQWLFAMFVFKVVADSFPQSATDQTEPEPISKVLQTTKLPGLQKVCGFHFWMNK